MILRTNLDVLQELNSGLSSLGLARCHCSKVSLDHARQAQGVAALYWSLDEDSAELRPTVHELKRKLCQDLELDGAGAEAPGSGDSRDGCS